MNARWLLTGFPLVLLGGVFIGLTFEAPDAAKTLMLALGTAYLTAGWLPLSRNRLLLNLAVLAWCPLLLAFPIGTLLGIFAIKTLRTDPGARAKVFNQVKRMTLSEMEEIVRSRAADQLDITSEQMGASLEELRITPGKVNQFLDDLDYDLGLPVSSDDRPSIATIQDLVDLLEQRQSGKGVDDQLADTIGS
jgi:hypothetical protein